MSRDDLLKMMQNDPLGILDVKEKTQTNTVDERLISNFNEINMFIDEHGREPESNLRNIIEHQLYVRLSEIRKDEDRVLVLKEYDRHNLLEKEIAQITSVKDILDNDVFGILDDPAEDIFNLKYMKSNDKNLTDYTARRKALKDFDKYENIFKQCHEDLRAGKRKLTKFNYSHMQLDTIQGRFFVLAGVLLYVEKIGKLTADSTGKLDGRTRLIFENGTYSTMKYRSLGKQLTLEGKTVTTTDEEDMKQYGIESEFSDKEIGYIYVLRSLSSDPYMQQIDDLHKIGFTTTEIEDRIKGAENEATYLMAPVKIVMKAQFPNKAVQKLEKLVHSFFKSVCIDLEVTDAQGYKHIAREWFTVPLDVIEQFLYLVSDNVQISDYYYDVNTKSIKVVE